LVHLTWGGSGSTERPVGGRWPSIRFVRVNGRKRRNIFAPELRTKKALQYQWPNLRAASLQTVWKRRRIEDGRGVVGFWLVFAIFCPKLLLILLALSVMP
jgi:hypothetical protein